MSNIRVSIVLSVLWVACAGTATRSAQAPVASGQSAAPAAAAALPELSESCVNELPPGAEPSVQLDCLLTVNGWVTQFKHASAEWENIMRIDMHPGSAEGAARLEAARQAYVSAPVAYAALRARLLAVHSPTYIADALAWYRTPLGQRYITAVQVTVDVKDVEDWLAANPPTTELKREIVRFELHFRHAEVERAFFITPMLAFAHATHNRKVSNMESEGTAHLRALADEYPLMLRYRLRGFSMAELTAVNDHFGSPALERAREAEFAALNATFAGAVDELAKVVNSVMAEKVHLLPEPSAPPLPALATSCASELDSTASLEQRLDCMLVGEGYTRSLVDFASVFEGTIMKEIASLPLERTSAVRTAVSENLSARAMFAALRRRLVAREAALHVDAALAFQRSPLGQKYVAALADKPAPGVLTEWGYANELTGERKQAMDALLETAHLVTFLRTYTVLPPLFCIKAMVAGTAEESKVDVAALEAKTRPAFEERAQKYVRFFAYRLRDFSVPELRALNTALASREAQEAYATMLAEFEATARDAASAIGPLMRPVRQDIMAQRPH